MKNAKVFQYYEFFQSFDKLASYPIYIIFGEENHIKDQVKQKLLDKFLKQDRNDFDFMILHGDDCEKTELIEQLETMPFLSKKKIIVLKNFDQLNVEGKKSLAKYSENPMATSILIIMTERFDKRISVNKALLKSALTIECKKPYNANQIAGWLRNELKRKNIFMDIKAIDLFANSIDTDFLIAKNELEKLQIWTKNSGTITYDDVKASVGQSRVYNIFELQNHIGNRNLKGAINILENMLYNDDPSIFVVTMLTRFFLILWKIEALRKRNISDSEISSRYLNNIYYKFRSDYLSSASNYSIPKIKKNLSLLLRADSDLKSMNLKENIIMQPLLVKIIN